MIIVSFVGLIDGVSVLLVGFTVELIVLMSETILTCGPDFASVPLDPDDDVALFVLLDDIVSENKPECR